MVNKLQSHWFMNKIYFVCQLLILLNFSLFGQISISKTPAWVDDITFEEKELKEDDYNGGLAYLLIDRQYNIETEALFLHFSYKILSEAGIQSGAVIEVNFDPTYEQLSFVGIDVVRDNARSSQLNPNNFQVIQKEANAERFIYDGEKTAILHLSDVRVGDIIDWKFILKGRNPVFKGKFFTSYYFNYQDPVGRIYMKIKAPSNKKLQIKHFETNVEPVTQSGRDKTYTWDMKNIEGLVYDSYAPSWYDPYAQVQISEYENWEQVINWALPLYTPHRNDLADIKEKAHSIQQQNEGKEKQISAALNFVQDEIRYLGFESGLNGFAPHAPSKVLRQRFGDCKDKSFLLSELLKAMDIEAYPALVNTEAGRTLPTKLPSPGVFDHCIVKVLVNGETFWYDPTFSNQGGEYNTTYFPDYGNALVIKKGTSELEIIKPFSYSKTEARETFTVKDFEQPAQLNVTTLYKGKEADYQRSFYMSNSLAQIQKNYLSYYADFFPGIKLAKDITYDDDPGVNIFTVYETYEVNDFWVPIDEGDSRAIKCEVYPQLVKDMLTDPGQTTRKTPFYLNYPKDIDQIIEFYLPEPWGLENVANKIEGPGIEYTSFVTSIDNKVTLNYTLKTKKGHLEPGEIKEYAATINKIKPDLGYTLTYNADLALAAGGSNISWLVVLLALVVFSIACLGAKKLYFNYDPFSPNKRIAYDAIGGWLILVGFGIVLSPFSMLFTIITQGYFEKEVWASITTNSSPNYNPALAAFFLFELLLNVVMLVFSGLTAILFIKRRSSFPRLAIIFYVSNFLFITVDSLIYMSLNISADSDLKDLYTQAARSFISMAIWVPYFLKSERVRETFVHTIKDYEDYEPISKKESHPTLVE